MNYKKVINEVINKLISEELSVSEYLIRGVKSSYKRIINKFGEFYGNGGKIDGKVFTNIQDTVSFGEYGSVDCYVTIIDFDSKKDMKEYFNIYDFGGETDQVNYRINLVIMSLNKEINDGFLYNTLYHEAEHSYQFLRNGKELHSVLSAYEKAVRILDGRDKEHNSNEFMMVSNLLYYYNKTEIEANINGLYGELIENGCKINETNFKVNLDLYENVFNEFVASYEDGKFKKVFSFFNITYNKLISFVKRQSEYITYRVRKVYQKALNDYGNEIEERRIIKPLGLYFK